MKTNLKTKAIYILASVALLAAGVCFYVWHLNKPKVVAFSHDERQGDTEVIYEKKYKQELCRIGVSNYFQIMFYAGRESESEFNHRRADVKSTSKGERFIEKVSPEELPVEKDPAGNWGPSADIFQLSARFSCQRFVKGEPVPIVLLLRNVGTNSLRWMRNGLPDHGYQFTLRFGAKTTKWMRPQNTDLTEYQSELSRGNPHPNSDPYKTFMPPHVQELTVFNLKRVFDLNKPGVYGVQAELEFPTQNNSTTNVVSGTAFFEIVEKLAK